MFYVLAAWTGYRRAELASVTHRSFDIETQPPTVSVDASKTKNNRSALIPLHPIVVVSLIQWFRSKADLSDHAPLFALKTPAGAWRRTAGMMKANLASARQKWIQQAQTPAEKAARERSDSLPAPPTKGDGLKEPAQLLRATGTDDHKSQPSPGRSLPPACHGTDTPGHTVAQQNTETGGQDQ